MCFVSMPAYVLIRIISHRSKFGSKLSHLSGPAATFCRFFPMYVNFWLQIAALVTKVTQPRAPHIPRLKLNHTHKKIGGKVAGVR